MTTTPQPEPHLDADQLNAFAEGALSATERALCLQHLAECAHCREISFLAGAALPAQERGSAPVRGFHFGWWTALSLGVVTLAAIIIVVVLLRHQRPNVPSAPVQIATESTTSSPPSPMSEPHPSDSVPATPPARAVPKPSPAERTRKPESPTLDNRQLNDAAVLDSVAASAQPGAGAAQQPAATSGMALKAPANPATMAPLGQPSPAQAGAAAKTTPSIAMRSYGAAPALHPSNSFAQIAGTITDSSGATIPRAKVTLDLTAGTAHRETFTDNSGQFILGSLPSGRYRLEFSAPGFQSQVREVELGISQVARADSQLATGSVSEAVTVESAASALNTESASLQSQLQDKAPPQTTVNSGSRTLTLDTDGKLFMSKNSGKHWKAVHGPWKKSPVTGLSLSPDQSFKVTTAGGSWLSADGERWHPAN